MLESTSCPQNKFDTAQNEIAEKAWPKDAPRISGCCDPIGSGWGGEQFCTTFKNSYPLDKQVYPCDAEETLNFYGYIPYSTLH